MPNLWVNKYSSSRKKTFLFEKKPSFRSNHLFFKYSYCSQGPLSVPSFYFMYLLGRMPGFEPELLQPQPGVKCRLCPTPPSTKKILKKYSLITAYSSEYCIVCFSAWPFLLQFFYYHLFAVSPDFRIACLYAFSNFCIASTITKY